ncbi:MAG: hypothetical protein ACLPWS_00855 [Rhodomicrobium sp.]
MVSGMPAVTVAEPYVVTGCPLRPPPIGNEPCVTGQWITGASRVTSGGQPLAIAAGASACEPTGAPLVPVQTQTRVTAA